MHKGTVEASSPGLGLGSEFVVRLPAQGDPSPGGDPEPTLPALRVLVVDDNVDYAEGIALLLQTSGYQVEVVHTGPEALLAVAEFHPDVVVLDIGLPGMDGYEVARRMRQDPDLDGIRVVGVSGYRQEADGLRSQGARFDDYLLKPLLMKTLEASLRP
jgi:two-component system, chemotaxis family, CheB/CheR fusion protein